MTQVILTAVGTAIGGPLGGAIGSAIGASIDQQIIASLGPARHGPRIDALRLTATAEGGPMPCVFGRARVGGQVIWAARFKEARIEHRTGGGKGGPKTVEYKYSLSFAVALCEGLIDGIGRVWADGKPLDVSGVALRLYRGTDDQTPDPLIEAVQGAAPAYRGCAYVVFEDLPLETFGNRMPQLSFEVFRRAAPEAGTLRLEDRLGGVCLIPGAGEFVYATEAVVRRDGLTRFISETVGNSQGRANLLVSLDQLEAQLPNVKSVMLVVSWFGTDLRLGACEIRPGVERLDKITLPMTWRAGGVDRAGAHLISEIDGGPAFGGTPCDAAVVQAITELKARGYRVGLYPFILMDIPPDNAMDQPAFPWRGRIAPNAGTDQTAAVATQVSHFFGAATPAHFAISGGQVDYSGPAEWGLRRMALHYARLAAMAGGVDTFLIGSELRGVTTARSAASAYPAVVAMQALAADCRTILGGGTDIGYAADWSEYFGHQPADGSGDVHFHLDPLWADDDIDFVGIDWYPPLADWREGEDHLDAEAGFKGPRDPAYIAANVAGGEGYDWFYAGDADRAAQVRTPISDGAYGEPWVFRPKDLKSWWDNAHHDRPGGVRSGSPTAWTPGMKPVRLIEFGCPAVDKGANAPNLFVDVKSSESALPPFSTGERDDEGQRIALEGVLTHFSDPANNPASTVYDGPMIADDALHAWCWDARPFPDFPARTALWADAPNWALGHWLNGRAGVGPMTDLVRAIAARGGVEVSADALPGLATGYVIDRPMAVRDALAPLVSAFAFDAGERDGAIDLVPRGGLATLTLTENDLSLEEGEASSITARRTLEPPVDALRVRFIDGAADYQTGAVAIRRDPATGGGSADLDLPMVMQRGDAEAVARRLLSQADAARDEVTVTVGPLAALRAEPGDLVAVEGLPGLWRILRVDADETPRLALVRQESDLGAVMPDPDWTLPAPTEPSGPPTLYLLDLPPIGADEVDARPICAVASEPWRAIDVSAGAGAGSLSARARVEQPATVGETLTDLPAGPLWRFDEGARLEVRVEGATLQSRTLDELLAGANAAAVRGPDGDWEILQFRDAEVIGPETYALTGLLRGQAGSEGAMATLNPAGAPFVLLNSALVRADVSASERGLTLTWRAAPAGAPAGGLAMTEMQFTWRGIAHRPWAPAHMSARADGGDLHITWTRRARLHGDSWEDEPPLSEETELYRVEVLDGEAVVRTVEATAPVWTYAAADQAVDFPAGAPNPLTVRGAQRSAVFGWGAIATRALSW